MIEMILPTLLLSLRVVISAFCGALIGLERERRFKNAGIRTHVIVCLSSALMVIVSKYGFLDVLSTPGTQVDPSRVAASIVSAIGFLGAGVIYFKKETTIGLTTSAGLWATVGIGLTIGAGMILLGLISTFFILLVQWFLHKRFFSNIFLLTAKLNVNLTNSDRTYEQICSYCEERQLKQKNVRIIRNKDNELIYTADISFPRSFDIDKVLDILKENDFIKAAELSTP